MNKNVKPALLLFAFLFMVSGCATFYLIKESSTVWKRSCFEAELPQGWVRYNIPVPLLFMTKDGELLQRITLTESSTKKEFTLSKKKISEDMLIQEIAEVVINEMSLNKNLQNFKVLENKPVNVGGIDGFRLVYAFNTEDYTKYKAILYGFIIGKKYYELQYLAASQRYFDKDLADFEEFINSFRVKERG